ncbi:hypothetical protein D3C86_2142160 [compost metagenome]
MYSEKTAQMRHYKVPAGEDMRNLKTVTPRNVLSGKAFDAIMEKATDAEPSVGKKME